MRQYNAHVNARTEYLINMIYEALGISDEVQGWRDWYAFGDELI